MCVSVSVSYLIFMWLNCPLVWTSCPILRNEIDFKTKWQWFFCCWKQQVGATNGNGVCEGLSKSVTVKQFSAVSRMHALALELWWIHTSIGHILWMLESGRDNGPSRVKKQKLLFVTNRESMACWAIERKSNPWGVGWFTWYQIKD